MLNLDLIGFCGVDCSVCPDLLNNKCTGCRASVGTSDEECFFVKCCLDKGVQICGQCSEFPCNDMKEFSEESEGHVEALRRKEEIFRSKEQEWEVLK